MVTEKEKQDGTKKKKKKGQAWPLPYCTTAPFAEHSRGADEDEPCDDARATDFEEKKDES